MLIRWCIPDVPRKLSERIRQEAYLTNEIIIKQEMIRARGSHAAREAVKVKSVAEFRSSMDFVLTVFLPNGK